MDRNFYDWERRSEKLGESLGSVMFASFPDSLNQLIHNWEFDIISKNLPKEKNIKVLDVGCGWGRLSYALSKISKNAFFYGIDISQSYVQMFNRKLVKRGRAVVGDLNKLPYPDNYFDYIFIVTTLMYLTNRQINNLIQELDRVIKNGGKLLVIENNISGHNYITGFGILSLIKKIVKRQNIHFVKSRVFYNGELEKYFKNDFFLIKKTGCSVLTFLLPFLLALSKLGLYGKSKITINQNFPLLPTLYNSYLLKKN